MEDPYPTKTFSATLRALGERFPNGDVDYHPRDGDVVISLPLKAGGSFRTELTWAQAKYLAFGKLTGDDLKIERLPADWPTSEQVLCEGAASRST